MRDPSILVWPDAFRPRSITPIIDRPLLKGPKPLDGREQVVASSAGGWLVQYEGVAVYGALYQQFRPLWIAMAAMGAPAYVKPDFLSALPSPTTTTFSDATTLSDGTLLAQSTGDCSLAAPATRGARTISVTNSVSRPRSVGDWFEIDGRAHLIQAIDGSNWTIWPTLRANYASGAGLEIDDPRVLAYLTPDSRANAMAIEARQLTLMSLEFIEAGW